ncbi:electron transfer flavoprotein subunit beta/FixA family protein [bacterium]|nr:electron transfer flavoprotein subunit beta/FixA family protein [bacterium]RQV96364.1 MAG: electron transfer flavoprotein subunit beta/FixA family protein [bacterium]
MNIIVCIKQVPETTEVKIDPKTNTLIREGVDSMTNPFDLWAIEEGVQIKEKLGGKVTALSMGPPQAEQVLRDAIAVNVDEGILLSDPAFAGADTLATSYTLAQAIRKIGAFDLILCGKQATDGDTAQVGPGIAVHLDIPQIVFVKKIREITKDRIVAERMVEEGIEVVESSLPCLVTVVKDINQPRMPSLRGKMMAKKAVVPVWGVKNIEVDPEKLGLQGSPTWVDKVFSPPSRSKGKIFEGETEAVVKGFIEALQEDKLLQ